MHSPGPEPGPPGFLAGLQPDEREAFESGSAERAYRPGDTLFHEGDESGGVFAITGGHAKVSCVKAGREVVMSFPGPGALLGELSALDGRPRSATVTALEPLRALVMPASDFRQFVNMRPRVALTVIEMLIRRLRDSDRQRIEYAAYDVVARLALNLLELAETSGEPVGDGVRITLALSQEELAGWTGSSREAVAKALHLLRELGWVRTERRRLTVSDMQALRDFAGRATL